MRATRKSARPGEIRVFYGRLPSESAADVIYSWGDDASKRDASMVNVMFSTRFPSLTGAGDKHNSFLQELEARGYDLSTLEFRISKKPAANQ